MKSKVKCRSLRLERKVEVIERSSGEQSFLSTSFTNAPVVGITDTELSNMQDTAPCEYSASTSKTINTLATASNIVSDPLPCKRKRVPVYFGDCHESDLNDPKKAKLMWSIATKTIERQRKQLKYLQTRNTRLRKRVDTLTNLLEHLKDSRKISSDCYSVLQECIPTSQRQILLRQMKITKEKQHPPELRIFALTLNFYSSAAYNYVRKIYGNCLPHPSTLKKWYSSVDSSPGYTKESLDAIRQKVNECGQQNKPLMCGLVMDEMSIRQHIEWNGNRQTGYINYGYNLDSDSLPIAKDVIAFLLVGLNCRWKIPVAYFLINGLSADEKANLVRGCFVMLHDTGVKVVSP